MKVGQCEKEQYGFKVIEMWQLAILSLLYYNKEGFGVLILE